MEASTSKDYSTFMPTTKYNSTKPETNYMDKSDTGTLLNARDIKVCKNEDMDVDIINCTNDDEDVEIDIVNFTNDDEDVEVDIINCANDDERHSVQLQSGDATASSTSFDDTYDDVRNSEFGSDSEVMSEFHGDVAPMRGFGGSADEFPVRNKRVTSHWRKFVQPIMWRCKWVEMQLRKLQTLTAEYDKQLEGYYQTKHLQYGNFQLRGLCAKSIPFLHGPQRTKPMKKKRRKRHEETDNEEYMSQHNLFSYYATCGSLAHGPTMDDDQPNLAPAPSTDKDVGNEFRVLDELLSLDFRDDYLLEQILYKIEVTHSHVCEMKNRLDTVVTDNAERISYTEDTILQESTNVLTCSVKESDFPTNMNGPSVVADFASQLMKLNTCEDLVKPDDEDLGHEELPVTSKKRSTDGILIYNRRAKKPQPDNTGAVNLHQIEYIQVPKEENSNRTAPVSVSEDSSQSEQPAPKIRSISKLTAPKHKRRAGRPRRKSASSRRTQG
ncbi:uncharacterized protein [Rutidosis leptorrhynchoides]|uniref:uncharacterized protein isoform X1 n=1 Tax=Rutidosis leptorrhynchoides TaxID=125765 RepID=UPI003A99373D